MEASASWACRGLVPQADITSSMAISASCFNVLLSQLSFSSTQAQPVPVQAAIVACCVGVHHDLGLMFSFVVAVRATDKKFCLMREYAPE